MYNSMVGVISPCFVLGSAAALKVKITKVKYGSPLEKMLTDYGFISVLLMAADSSSRFSRLCERRCNSNYGFQVRVRTLSVGCGGNVFAATYQSCVFRAKIPNEISLVKNSLSVCRSSVSDYGLCVFDCDLVT